MQNIAHESYKNILESARGKANYYVTRDTEGISRDELCDFYNIGKIYRKEQKFRINIY